jgi:GNAT superfamily N-acetyltransferase
MWSAGDMTLVRIEPLQTMDRPAVVKMLGEDRELGMSVPASYDSANLWDRDWVAWDGDQIIGLLTGTFGLEFSDSHFYGHFDLPRKPHALVHRIFTRVSERGNGVGPQLLAFFAQSAIENNCTFIVGALDLDGYLPLRRRFFKRFGFAIAPNDTFGAEPEAVLCAIAD